MFYIAYYKYSSLSPSHLWHGRIQLCSLSLTAGLSSNLPYLLFLLLVTFFCLLSKLLETLEYFNIIWVLATNI